MALKPLRKVDEGQDISNVMRALPTGVTKLERGVIVTRDTSYSGTGKVGDGNNVVEVPTGTGGTPVGLLATDVVDIDLSEYPHFGRMHRDEVPLCSPVNLVTHGYVFTDRLKTGDTPSAHDPAYFTADGELTTTAGSARVGTFRGVKDSDGYVGVDVDLGV